MVDEVSEHPLAMSAMPAYKPPTSNPLFSAAIKNTDLGHFKFPWKKGPLSAFLFATNDSRVPLPKLQPRFNNAVSLDLKVAAELKWNHVYLHRLESSQVPYTKLR